MKIMTIVGTRPELIRLSEIFNYNKTYFNVSGIYSINNIVNNKIYVGSTNNIYYRLRDHIYRLRNESHYNEYLQRSFLKYGEDSFYFNVLEKCCVDLLVEREQFYMDNLKSTNSIFGYNIAITANGSVISEETKKKISEAQKGKPGHRLGFKVTDITKEKLRLINTGKITSEETKIKISNALKGRNTWAAGSTKGPMSLKTKEKISLKNQGSGNGMAKSVVFIKDGFVREFYGSAYDAATFHGIKDYTLRLYIRDNKSYDGGYFKYEV